MRSLLPGGVRLLNAPGNVPGSTGGRIPLVAGSAFRAMVLCQAGGFVIAKAIHPATAAGAAPQPEALTGPIDDTGARAAGRARWTADRSTRPTGQGHTLPTRTGLGRGTGMTTAAAVRPVRGGVHTAAIAAGRRTRAAAGDGPVAAITERAALPGVGRTRLRGTPTPPGCPTATTRLRSGTAARDGPVAAIAERPTLAGIVGAAGLRGTATLLQGPPSSTGPGAHAAVAVHPATTTEVVLGPGTAQ